MIEIDVAGLGIIRLRYAADGFRNAYFQIFDAMQSGELFSLSSF